MKDPLLVRWVKVAIVVGGCGVYVWAFFEFVPKLIPPILDPSAGEVIFMAVVFFVGLGLVAQGIMYLLGER